MEKLTQIEKAIIKVLEEMDDTTFVNIYNSYVRKKDNKYIYPEIMPNEEEFVNKYLEVEERYAWGMGNRILQVGKNLLELYKFDDIGGTRDSENVENVMNNVVTKFQILNMR